MSNVETRNIKILAQEVQSQRTKIVELEQLIEKTNNAIAILQAELATVKTLATYSLGNGPTA